MLIIIDFSVLHDKKNMKLWINLKMSLGTTNYLSCGGTPAC